MNHAIAPLPPPRSIIAWVVALTFACVTAALGWRIGALTGGVAGPDLRVLGPPVVDLGSGRPGQVLKHELRLMNRGPVPGRFRVSASCACVAPDPNEGVVPPYGWIAVQIGLRLRDRGTTENAVVRINSDDSSSRPVSLQVSGRCPAAVTLSTTAIDFGWVSRQSTPQSRIVQIIESLEPLDRFELRYPPDRLEVARTGQSLSIRPRTDVPDGSYSEVVRFLSRADPDLEARLTVDFRLGPQLSLVPSAIPINEFDGTRRKKILVLAVDGSMIARLSRHDGGEDWGLTDETVDERAPRRVVSVSRGALASARPLRMWFGGEQAPVVLTIEADAE